MMKQNGTGTLLAKVAAVAFALCATAWLSLSAQKRAASGPVSEDPGPSVLDGVPGLEERGVDAPPEVPAEIYLPTSKSIVPIVEPLPPPFVLDASGLDESEAFLFSSKSFVPTDELLPPPPVVDVSEQNASQPFLHSSKRLELDVLQPIVEPADEAP